jgi:hypothetical protein
MGTSNNNNLEIKVCTQTIIAIIPHAKIFVVAHHTQRTFQLFTNTELS